jgi:hypothetical protein
MPLQIVTIEEIAKFSCYHPSKYLPKNWSGTALDILNVTDCPVEDRLYVVKRRLFLSDTILRLFAVNCNRYALGNYSKKTDPRSHEACDVAERFAHGNATIEELSIAKKNAAYDAYDAYNAAYAAYNVAGAAAVAAAAYAAYVAGAAGAAARNKEYLRQIEVLKELCMKYGE